MPSDDQLHHWCPDGGGDLHLVVVGTQENKFKVKRPTEQCSDAGNSDAGNTGRNSITGTAVDDEDMLDTCASAADVEIGENSGGAANVDFSEVSGVDLDEVAVYTCDGVKLADTEHGDGAGGVAVDALLAKGDQVVRALHGRTGHTKRGARASACRGYFKRVGKSQSSKKMSSSENLMNPWEAMVSARLGAQWTICSHVVLWEQRLTVYARKEDLAPPPGQQQPRVHAVQTGWSRTGVGGVLGNKGGIVIKLCLGDTSLVFVSAHLAAHAHKLTARNDDCQEVRRSPCLSHHPPIAASYLPRCHGRRSCARRCAPLAHLNWISRTNSTTSSGWGISTIEST